MQTILNKFIIGCLFMTATAAFSASFDCGKAKTYHEKFICSNPQLDALDKQLGESYSTVNKGFPLKGYIPATHKSWLSSYRACAGTDKVKKEPTEALRNCSEEVAKRVDLYGSLSNASVYTDFKEKDLNADGGTFIIHDKNQTKFLRYFGGWMPDGNQDKGYPYAGYWCDNAFQLKKKGSGYVVDDGPDSEINDGISSDFEIKFTEKSLSVIGSINCGLRASIGNGKFDRR